MSNNSFLSWNVIAGFYCLLCVVCTAVADESPKKEWPDVLVIDDFSTGLGKWENQDTGVMSVADGPMVGRKALLWTSTDDSVGQIIFKNLKREEIDFSQYDLLLFDLKVDGRPIWNLNPIVQQYPAVYGFRGFYYSVDTMHLFGKWFTCYQDLSRWKNSLPETFSTENQEFRFEVYQLAGADQTKLYLSNMRLVKNPIGVKPSYHGSWEKLPDGRQVTSFDLTLKNKRNRPLTVRLGIDQQDAGTLQYFAAKIPGEPLKLAPGTQQVIRVSMEVPAEVLKRMPSWYGEIAHVAVRVDEIPGFVFQTKLIAGSKPVNEAHPLLLCDTARMNELHSQYADPAQRPTMARELLEAVKNGEAALAYKPDYPPSASPGRTTDPVSGEKLQRIEMPNGEADLLGRTTDPVSGGKLQRIEVPNLPFDVYQDPKSGRTYSGPLYDLGMKGVKPNLPFDVYQDLKSGRTYSGPLYDAGMKGWKERHLENAVKAKILGVAYLVSGRKEFAEASARILRDYIEKYLALPINSYEHGSQAGSACSGSVRIDGTYMRERIWLTDMALALDSIRPSGVLSDKDVGDIAEKIFVPSAMNMEDHEVGVMNLQMQIQSSALYAGLAVGDPGLVARSVYSDHGILRLIDIGYLPDGNWWENPSYQNVLNLCAYPVMAVCLRNGIMLPSTRIADILTSFYRLSGPDGFTPELGTGNGRVSAVDDTAGHVFAPLIDDPRLAWIAYNRKPARYVDTLYFMAIAGGGNPKIPPEKAVSPIATGTVDFPDYGGIAMRIPGSDAYAYMQYGREVTHGHINKLSVQAYGKGGWYMRNVMGGYQNNFKDFLETIASSTSIMVDGRNANRDTGKMLFKKSADGVEIVSAKENNAWTNVEHERTVVLTKGPLIVLDRCLAEEEHTYDWLYHANGCGLTLDTKDPLPSSPGKLGDTTLYSGLVPAGQFPSVGKTSWKRENGSGMRMALLPLGELFLTNIKDATRPSQGLLWRQRGKTCVFASALLPYVKGENGHIGIEPLSAMVDGKKVGFDVGQAYRITAPEGIYTVLVNYGGKLLRAEGVETAERVAVFVTPSR